MLEFILVYVAVWCVCERERERERERARERELYVYVCVCVCVVCCVCYIPVLPPAGSMGQMEDNRESLRPKTKHLDCHNHKISVFDQAVLFFC